MRRIESFLEILRGSVAAVGHCVVLHQLSQTIVVVEEGELPQPIQQPHSAELDEEERARDTHIRGLSRERLEIEDGLDDVDYLEKKSHDQGRHRDPRHGLLRQPTQQSAIQKRETCGDERKHDSGVFGGTAMIRGSSDVAVVVRMPQYVHAAEYLGNTHQ